MSKKIKVKCGFDDKSLVTDVGRKYGFQGVETPLLLDRCTYYCCSGLSTSIYHNPWVATTGWLLLLTTHTQNMVRFCMNSPTKLGKTDKT